MAETTPDTSPEESAKDKMRHALEQKKNREHLANESRRNTGSIHGSQAGGGQGKRPFRRKSG